MRVRVMPDRESEGAYAVVVKSGWRLIPYARPSVLVAERLKLGAKPAVREGNAPLLYRGG